MQSDPVVTLDRIKHVLQVKNNSALARVLGIGKSQVARWKVTGWHTSTESLILKLLDISEKVHSPETLSENIRNFQDSEAEEGKQPHLQADTK
jgi:hypothetical protein